MVSLTPMPAVQDAGDGGPGAPPTQAASTMAGSITQAGGAGRESTRAVPMKAPK